MNTVIEREPVAIAGTLDSALDAYLDQMKGELSRDPENTFKAGICRHCACSLGPEPEDKVIPMGALGFLPNTCCPACAEIGKERLKEEQRKGDEERLRGIVPTEFLHWDELRGNNAALARAMGKLNVSLRRCMVIHGRTGSCKSRIAWEIIKKLAMMPDNLSWHWLDAFEVADKGFPKEARTADYLVIDDLGNEPKKNWETKWETELLYVIRKRCDWRKPLIITTQLTPDEFRKRFFNTVAAAAIMRRFRERTDAIATDA